MVILVTGAGGQLGQALGYVAPEYPQIRFVFADSTTGDVTNPEALASLFQTHRPDYCINASAYTAVDKAESEPDKARAINVVGAANLARICHEYQCVLLHVSTDFVFDGNHQKPYTEKDQPNPTGVYGLTKLQGEQAVFDNTDAAFVIRTSWVYSQFGNNFMKTMLRLGAERTELNVVDDQIGTPTHAVDLARALVTVCTSGSRAFGIYHFSNEGQTSWYGFAREIFRLHQADIALHPIPTAAYPTPARRPGYSVLDKSKFRSAFQVAVRDWKQALAKGGEI